MTTTRLQVKRAYEAAANSDGERYLVDRLWPRGVRKDALSLTGWLKDVAPGSALRVWFGHDPSRWQSFRRRYRKELESNPDGLQTLRNALARGVVTLVYAARDEEHNHALVLRDFLLETPAGSCRKRVSSK